MTKRKSDFREDREFSYDCPDDDATLQEKLDYQRKLRKFWESCELPSALPFAGPDAKWWELPYGQDPAIETQRQLRKLGNGR